MQRHCLALDLKNDPKLIAEYDAWHRMVWPEVKQSIWDAGITVLDIYRVQNRLFMILEADDNFSLEKKAKSDATNPKVQEWETLMWKYQEALPGVPKGSKWALMEKVFSLG